MLFHVKEDKFMVPKKMNGALSLLCHNKNNKTTSRLVYSHKKRVTFDLPFLLKNCSYWIDKIPFSSHLLVYPKTLMPKAIIL